MTCIEDPQAHLLPDDAIPTPGQCIQLNCGCVITYTRKGVWAFARSQTDGILLNILAELNVLNERLSQGSTE